MEKYYNLKVKMSEEIPNVKQTDSFDGDTGKDEQTIYENTVDGISGTEKEISGNVSCEGNVSVSNVSSHTIILSEGHIVFPVTRTLSKPYSYYRTPKIVVEDWTDNEYYRYNGEYLEDLAGTGIYRIMENHPPCIKINDNIYSIGCNIFNYPNKCANMPALNEIIFDNCYVNHMCTKQIHIENLGPYVLRYKWKKLPNYDNKNFPIRKPINREHRMYFDINPSTLVPGEKKILNIIFKSIHTGVYTEDWELLIFPKVHTERIIFTLRTVAMKECNDELWLKIDKDLNRLVSRKIVKNILNNIIAKIFEKPVKITPPTPVSATTEQELFLHINGNSFSYNEEIISNLKEHYQSIFGCDWNYNMYDFEEGLISSNAFQNKVNNLYKFKSHKILLMKLSQNILIRDYYQIYFSIYNILGDAIENIQNLVTDFRRKYNLSPIPAIKMLENEYYYFPEPQIPEGDIYTKATSAKKLPADKAATAKKPPAEKATAKTPKKKEYIELIPRLPLIYTYKEWEPENESYKSDVYDAVYSVLITAINEITVELEDYEKEND